MIALLRGEVVTCGLDRVVLDVHGVGYEVHVPPGSVTAARGAEVTLHTHLAVREDALTLYGFCDTRSLQLFTTLLGVNGVGPKVALAALGALGTDGLHRAVIAEDVAAITRTPGIGRKGAQRIVLELREALGATPETAPGADGTGSASAGPRREVVEALTGLGYSSQEVQRAVERLSDAEGPAEELLRRALRTMTS